jgi:hypothetical protein
MNNMELRIVAMLVRGCRDTLPQNRYATLGGSRVLFCARSLFQIDRRSMARFDVLEGESDNARRE